MENKDNYDDLTDQLKNYIKTNLELVKMQGIDKVVIITPAILSGTLISLIIYLSILFLSFGLSIYLSVILKSTYHGFLIVGGFYLILGIILLIARKDLLVKPIRNLFIKVIFKQK